MGASQPVISIKGVSKSFCEAGVERYALDDISCEIYPGQFTAIIGQSGSGKSTLLNLMSGVDTPTAGEVIFSGRSLGSMTEHERTLFRREHIGIVFQFYNLIPTLTVEENVALPLELAAVGRRARLARAHALLERVGLASRARSFPEVLSGGEQQRVAIARALAHEPLAVLADEPTGNLDPETSRETIELLLEVVAEESRTLVMATHEAEIIPLAARVLVIGTSGLTELTDAMRTGGVLP